MNSRGTLKKFQNTGRIFLIVVLAAAFSGLTSKAQAAAVSSFSDSLSTIQESVVANHTITFTINDAWSASETLSIDFPNTFVTTGFTNADDNDYDITDDAVDVEVVASGACAANKIEITTANTSTDTFTFTLCSGSTTIATSSVIVIEIGSHANANGTGDTQITNQSATENNSDALVTLAGDFGGSGQLALEIVADNTTTVSATVNSSITCAFTGLTTTFSGIDTGSVSTADTTTTLTISSNAANGVVINVRDEGSGSNPGLYKSSAPTYLIASSDATLSAGTDGYGIQGASSGGSGAALTVDSTYDVSGNVVGGLVRTAFPASSTNLATSSGALASRVLTVTYKAAASGLAYAGAYTDTVTYACTGIY